MYSIQIRYLNGSHEYFDTEEYDIVDNIFLIKSKTFRGIPVKVAIRNIPLCNVQEFVIIDTCKS